MQYAFYALLLPNSNVSMLDSPLAGNGAVPRHGLGWHLEVGVGSVEEGLAALRQGLEHQRGGGGAPLQRRARAARAAGTPAVLHIEAGTKDEGLATSQLKCDQINETKVFFKFIYQKHRFMQ